MSRLNSILVFITTVSMLCNSPALSQDNNNKKNKEISEKIDINSEENHDAVKSQLSTEFCRYIKGYSTSAGFIQGGIGSFRKNGHECSMRWAMGGYSKYYISSVKISNCGSSNCDFAATVRCSFQGYMGAKGCEGMTRGVNSVGDVKINEKNEVTYVNVDSDSPY